MLGKAHKKRCHINDINVGESNRFQYLKMLVLGDDIFGIRMNGTINKLIIITILFYESETIYRMDELDINRQFVSRTIRWR